MKYAVSLSHLIWQDADDEEEAIEQAIEELAEMDEDTLAVMDFDVVDAVPEDEW